MSGKAFDPARTCLHLAGDGAVAPVEAGERFRSDLMAGRFALADGHLVAAGGMTSDTGHREMHPEGGEAPPRTPGAFTVVLERGDGRADEVRLDGETPRAVAPRGARRRPA